MVPLEHPGQGHRGIDVSRSAAAGQKQFHVCLSPFKLVISLVLCLEQPRLSAEKGFAFSNKRYPALAAGICRDTLNIMPISASCIISAVPP